MAKRSTAIGKRGNKHPHKTAKRLEVKRLMLEKKNSKKKK